jgi:hypothetical protein
MTYATSTIEELQGKSLKEILHSVLIDQKILAVLFPDGAEIVIQPRPRLQPLPILNGYIPNGWKEAIYDEPL